MKHLKSAWKHIRRSPYQSLTAVMIVTITFFVATLFILIALFSSAMLDFFGKQPQLTIYFEDAKTSREITDLQNTLQTNSQVEAVNYISKQEALKIYQEDHKDDPLLLEMVTAEILPASLEIQTTKAEFLDDIAKQMQKESGVEEVVYQQDVVKRLISWTKSIRALGGILLGILTFETLLVILTIVGVRIINKQKEISILQLIGASSWYVKMPFIIEGALYGLTGASLGWLLSYGLLQYQYPFVQELLRGVENLTLPYLANITIWPLSLGLMLAVLGIISALGIFLGVVGSLIATHRYLE